MVPYRKKSYHSTALPTALPNSARRRSRGVISDALSGAAVSAATLGCSSMVVMLRAFPH